MTRHDFLTVAPYLLWAILWGVLAAGVPALEISEPRYLTAAWEMFVRGDYILPTLNFVPYHHKPPLLMWMINLSWATFGYNVWAARVVIGAIMLGLLWATRRLAYTLWPNKPEIGLYAPFVVLISPIMLSYGGQIMFDSLVTLIVTLGLVVVWRQSQNLTWGKTALTALILTLGGLAKGPVILLFILPALLLAPFWIDPSVRTFTWKKWYILAAIATIAGIAGALLWAIPAAIRGGPAYAEMIFWGQSAGRVVKSFAHRQPFWFYVPILAGYIAPLLLWPAFWQAIVQAWRDRTRDPAICFLGISFIVPFIIFSMISGKQTHYMMPIFPILVVLITYALLRKPDVKRPAGMIWGIVALPVLTFIAVPVLGLLAQGGHLTLHENTAMTILETYSLPLTIVAAALCLWMGYSVRRAGVAQQIPVLATLMIVLVSVSLLQFSISANRLFDLQPVANALQAYKDQGRPIGYQSLYRGQIGFLARMKTPVHNVRDQDMEQWFAQNPNGVLVQRIKNEEWHHAPYRLLFDMPYRSNDRMVIIGR